MISLEADLFSFLFLFFNKISAKYNKIIFNQLSVNNYKKIMISLKKGGKKCLFFFNSLFLFRLVLKLFFSF